MSNLLTRKERRAAWKMRRAVRFSALILAFETHGVRSVWARMLHAEYVKVTFDNPYRDV